jgi:predicted RNA-binding protein with TRAM domain
MSRRFRRKSFKRWSKGSNRHFFKSQPLKPAPIAEGEEYEVTGEAEGRMGNGIAKIKGFTVFVAGLKVGEKAKVKIVSVRPRFAIGVKAVKEV